MTYLTVNPLTRQGQGDSHRLSPFLISEPDSTAALSPAMSGIFARFSYSSCICHISLLLFRNSTIVVSYWLNSQLLSILYQLNHLVLHILNSALSFWIKFFDGQTDLHYEFLTKGSFTPFRVQTCSFWSVLLAIVSIEAS